MRVLVTGGAGFIGSHFARRLAAGGDEVVVLDKLTYCGNRSNLEGVPHEFAHGDITESETVARAGEGCQAVVNFAAETHVDRSIIAADEFLKTDVLGTHVLLEWARATGARFVQVSTDEVYGDVEQGAAQEGAPLRPSSPYSASKAGGDMQVLAHARTYGLDVRVTRGANTYGPNQYPEKLIPLFVTNALESKPVPVYGDGQQRRQWLHVGDHCAAIDLVLRAGAPGSVYNVAGEERKNLDVARSILDILGLDSSWLRHVADRPGHDRRYAVDSTRIEALGWSRAHDFAEGLVETVAWYRDNRSWWEPLKSGEYSAYYERQYAERLGGGEHLPLATDLGVKPS
jgi:dTDP-glucose 4,6-dehydratase